MKSIIKNVLTGSIRGLSCAFGHKFERQFRRITADALDLMNVTQEQIVLPSEETLVFHCPNDLTRWRIDTFFEKEPETLEWIDQFQPGDTLWDVGANIGLYSIYAAKRGCKVLAFEPSSANYFVLNANIRLNNVADFVDAYCLALSDRDQLGRLNLQMVDYGGAMSSFNSTVGFDGKSFPTTFEQGMIGYSIDKFVEAFSAPFPNHIKIDVDGIEDLIITGAPAVLADARLKSLSIELDDARPEYTSRIAEQIETCGLKFKDKGHSHLFDEGSYSNINNYHFMRD